MNKKFFSSLSIVAVAFALVFGFGNFNNAGAVPGLSGDAYDLPDGQVNLFANEIEDGTRAVVVHRDADAMSAFETDNYGLLSKSQQ